MESLFLKIFNMSITAGWIVLAVILLRLLLKKAPRSVICVLWAFVGLRLILPFSFESGFSLVPSQKQISQAITKPTYPIVEHFDSVPADRLKSYIGDIDGVAVEIPAVEIPLQNTATGTDFYSALMAVISVVWLSGIVVLLSYALISWLKLRKTVSESACIGENIYICDRIDSPFILGVFVPKIYMPSSMDKDLAEHVISHEKAHLKRFDHLWKPLGYLVLTVHWFNPLVWVAYILLCRDIELACDEAVIKKMSAESKKAYSTALLACSIHRKKIAACPLAFGEVGVKERIHNVLNYKKPAFWVIILSIIACTVLAVCFMTDPKDEVPSMLAGSDFTVEKVLVGEGNKYQKFSITADMKLYLYDDGTNSWKWYGNLKSASLTAAEIEASLVESYDVGTVSDYYYLFYGNVYYAAFKTVNGETYICRGLSPDRIEELYLVDAKLGKVGDNYVTDEDFFNRSLRANAGDNVSVFHFAFMDDFLVVGFTAGTESYSGFQNDMGYAIFTMHDDGYILKECFVYENAALVTSGIYVCPDPAVLSENGEMTDKNTYDVVLSYNSKLAEIKISTRIVNENYTHTRTVPITGKRSMMLFRWSDDRRSEAGSSVSYRFYDANGNELPWSNVIPESEDIQQEDLRAVSGHSNCLVYAFETGTPLEEIKNKVNWLKIALDGDLVNPFNLYVGNREIFGHFYLYDAESLESVQFIHPSGLSPQTYILQNTVRGNDYLVVFRANPYGTGADENLYAFGITLPLLEEVTDPFAESDSPITWLKNLSVDDVYTVTAKIGGGDGLDFGIRMIRSLVEALNSVPDHAVYMGRGVPYETSVTVKCGSRTYTLGYGGGLVEIGFDSQTRSLYPDGIWQINDPNLAAWFEDFMKNGLSVAGENDPLDFAVDFIREFYSFYGNEEIPEMDFSEYTDIETLAAALEYIRGKKINSDLINKYYYCSVTCSASYLDGAYSERIYVSVLYDFDYHSGSGGGHSRYSFDFAIKSTDNGYLITDFRNITDDFRYPGDQGYRYGIFGYFPIDDWEKNGEKYLSIIKGETERISELELGKQLLAEFEANIENYKEKYKIYDVSFEEYFENNINPAYFLYEQASQIGSGTKSQGVIIVFNDGRYVASIGGYIVDPLIVDGTIPDDYYVVQGVEAYSEYFEWIRPVDGTCYFMDAQYIVALD